MALVLADRVRETTTTTGTGTVSLAGPVSGFQGFSTAIGNANTTYYTIADAATGAWEVGLGTYTSSGSTLARTTILSSSNAGAAVNFAAGTKDVFVTQPAERALYLNGAGTGVDAGAAAFTANGVVYASSTSALATGSALTFDGSAFAVTGTLSATGTLSGGTSGTAYSFSGSAPATSLTLTSGGDVGIGTPTPGVKLDVAGAIRSSVSGGTPIIYWNNGTTQHSISNSAGTMPFAIDGTEKLRLTATSLYTASDVNVGIGTSSPGAKLDVATTTQFAFSESSSAGVKVGTQGTAGGSFMVQTQSASAPYGSGLAIDGTYSSGTLQSTVNIKAFGVYSGGGYGSSLAFHTSSGTTLSQKMLLDASGNLGLGVTPSAWNAGGKIIEVGSAGSILFGTASATGLTKNASYISGWKYQATGAATYYEQYAGSHIWQTAPSGTAGDPITFTQAMTLDASGNLGVGSTLPSARLSLGPLVAAQKVLLYDNNDNYKYGFGIQSNELRQFFPSDAVLTFGTISTANGSTFTERARITSGGTFQTSLDASIYGVTVGRGAGAVATNTALGVNALAASNSGDGRNTGLGYAALAANTTGSNNTGLGQQALTTSQTGDNNVAIGYASLFLNVSGSSNVAVGVGSLQNTTASNNTAVGFQAGYTNATGASNTFVGYTAGRTSNYNGDAYNTAIGERAGFELTTGTINTFVGSGAGYYVSSGAKNTIIGRYSGNQGGLDIRTASNYIVLSDGDGNPRMWSSPAEEGAISTPSANYRSTRSVIVSALNTDYALYNFAISAILYFRDNSTGGSAAYLWDPNQGLVTIATNLSGKTLSFSFSGGITYVRQTAGSVPTNYTYNALSA